jgi:hypothetical protein
MVRRDGSWRSVLAILDRDVLRVSSTNSAPSESGAKPVSLLEDDFVLVRDEHGRALDFFLLDQPFRIRVKIRRGLLTKARRPTKQQHGQQPPFRVSLTGWRHKGSAFRHKCQLLYRWPKTLVIPDANAA